MWTRLNFLFIFLLITSFLPIKVEEEHKPSLLAFVGSSWCPFSQQFVQDILPELEKQWSVALIDYPERGAVLPQEVALLQERFQIEAIPTLLLLDANQQEVCRVPYNAAGLSAKITANYAHYMEINSAIAMGEKEFSAERLAASYMLAKEIGNRRLQLELISIGLKNPTDTFFLFEKYQILAENFEINKEEMKDLRRQIIRLDPAGALGSQLMLAFVDFRAKSGGPLSKRESAERAIEPLLLYVKKFGGKDKAALWRAHSAISEYLFTRAQFREALEHAKAAHASAPAEVKPQIEKEISYIKSCSSEGEVN